MDLEDDPLQAALATAFADTHVPPRDTTLAPPPPIAQEPSLTLSETPPESSDDSWKSDYDRLLASFRAESAVTREKAERERERWRLIREAEGGAEHKEAEWETVERLRKEYESKAALHAQSSESGQTPPPSQGSRMGDLSTSQSIEDSTFIHAEGSESSKSLSAHIDTSGSDSSPEHTKYVDTPAPTITPPSYPDSRTWEEVPSLNSSFPSLSFADRSTGQSPEPREHPPPPPSMTLAIFDSSLSKRARLLALASSLAINLFLPFINGVMLGFGEIFAKNVVTAFGWELPGTQLGIRATRRR